MKKVLAIVLSVAMLISCMPMMAFAEAPTPEQKAESREEVDDRISNINKAILDYLTDQKTIDFYREVSKNLDEIIETVEYYHHDVVDLIVDQLEEGNTEAIEQYAKNLDELISKLNELVDEFTGREDVQEKIEEVIAKAEEIKKYIEEKGYDQISIDDLKEMAEDLANELIDAIASIDRAAVEDAINELINKAIEEGLIDEETIDEILDSIEEALDYIDEYKGLSPEEVLDKMLEDGVFDPVLEAMGMDPEELEAIIETVQVIAENIDPEEMLQDLMTYAVYAGLLGYNFQDALDEIAQLTEDADSKDEIINKFINGYKLMKKKPAIKKAKAKKGKKIQVTFKGMKGLEATKYQVQAKAKKAKTRKATVKITKKNNKKKTFKTTVKKLKKGKKYSVKVRATYSFKYKGKTYTFNSKWSKAKKAKVKK